MSHPITPKHTGTHPGPASAGGGKGPQPTGPTQKQPGAVAYAQKVPLSDAAKAGDSKAMPMPDGNKASVQKPSDVKVPTERSSAE